MFADRNKYIITSTLLTAFCVYTLLIYILPAAKQKPVNHNQAAGKLLWQRHNCQSCHQIFGLGGYLGPDLSNTYSLKGPAYIRAFLQHGNEIMPDFSLKEDDIRSLTEYLHQVDSSGNADPRHFILQPNGNITE